MVYTGSTLSLAALEVLVHLPVRMDLDFFIFRVEFADDLIEELAFSDLPRNWRAEPPSPSTQSIGDAWVREARSPVLSVPSAIIPQERNFLLNPQHPDFPAIHPGPPEPFAFDPRLLRELKA